MYQDGGSAGSVSPCRTAAWGEVVATSTAAWKRAPAAATKAALAALTLASSSGEVAQAVALIDAQARSGVLSADEAHAAVVRVRTNAGIVAFNAAAY